MTKMQKFLELVETAGWRIKVPPNWSNELQSSLSNGLVRVGFGGKIELTPKGQKKRQESHD